MIALLGACCALQVDRVTKAGDTAGRGDEAAAANADRGTVITTTRVLDKARGIARACADVGNRRAKGRVHIEATQLRVDVDTVRVSVVRDGSRGSQAPGERDHDKENPEPANDNRSQLVTIFVLLPFINIAYNSRSPGIIV